MLRCVGGIVFEQVEASWDFGGAGMELEFGAVFEGLAVGGEQSEGADKPLGGLEIAGLGEDAAAVDIFVIQLGQVEGGALTAFDGVGVAAVDLDGFDAAFGATGEEGQFVADAGRAGGGNAADDGAEALDGKGAFDGLAEDAVGAFGANLGDHGL